MDMFCRSTGKGGFAFLEEWRGFRGLQKRGSFAGVYFGGSSVDAEVGSGVLQLWKLEEVLQICKSGENFMPTSS